MEDLLKQLEKSIVDKQYYMALMVCLSLPDICSALQSKNGEAKKISMYVGLTAISVQPMMAT